MGTAGQVLFAATDALQQAAHPLDVAGLGIMGCAAERELLAGEAELLDHAVFYQGEGLERLGGGAPEGHEVGVAGTGHERALGVDDRDVDAVHRLGAVAAALLDTEASGVQGMR